VRIKIYRGFARFALLLHASCIHNSTVSVLVAVAGPTILGTPFLWPFAL